MKSTMIRIAMQLSIALVGIVNITTAMRQQSLPAEKSFVQRALDEVPEVMVAAKRRMEERAQYYAARIADEDAVLTGTWASERDKAEAKQKIREIEWQRANEFTMILTGVKASVQAQQPQEGGELANPQQKQQWQEWAGLLLPLIRKNEQVLGLVQGIVGLAGVKANEWGAKAQLAPAYLSRKAEEDRAAITNKYKHLMAGPMSMLQNGSDAQKRLAQGEMNRLEREMKKELEANVQQDEFASNSSKLMQGALNMFQDTLQGAAERLATGTTSDNLLTVEQALLRIQYLEASYQSQIEAAEAQGDKKTIVFLKMRLAKEIAAICVVERADNGSGPIIEVMEDEPNQGALRLRGREDEDDLFN